MDGRVARRLVERFEPIVAHDPRVKRRQLHRLIDVVVLAVCGVLSGCESFTDIERYGKRKRAFFEQFLELPNGIPSHDTFSRVFARLKPAVFGECLRNWINDFRDCSDGDHVAIDGKTLRGTFHRASEKSPLHSVSAWSTKYGLTLGQVATAAKSNEITAIPELIRLIELEGAVVTIDAMGCQTEIAAEIQAAGADYVLALKDNHPTLAAQVQAAFEDHLESSTAEQGKPRSLESTRALTDQATSKHRQYSWQTKNVRLGRRLSPRNLGRPTAKLNAIALSPPPRHLPARRPRPVPLEHGGPRPRNRSAGAIMTATRKSTGPSANSQPSVTVWPQAR